MFYYVTFDKKHFFFRQVKSYLFLNIFHPLEKVYVCSSVCVYHEKGLITSLIDLPYVCIRKLEIVSPLTNEEKNPREESSINF